MRRVSWLSATTAALLTFLASGPAAGQSVVTVAGKSHDSIPATKVPLFLVSSVAVDRAGNVYFSEGYANRIQKVSAATGTLQHVIGFGPGNDAVEGEPAATALAAGSLDLAVDAAGNLFYTGLGIERVDAATGLVSRVVPNPTGDWCLGVAVGPDGDVYVSYGTHTVRRVSKATGAVSVVAGTGEKGFSGDGGQATAARFDFTWGAGLTVDSGGNLWIADSANNRFRKVDAATGIVTTVAGNGTTGFSGDGGPATSAAFSFYGGPKVAVDSAGNLFVPDTNNCRVRRVDAKTGVVTTVAGTSCGECRVVEASDATKVPVCGPGSLALDPSGDLVIGLWNGQAVQRLSLSTGRLSVVAGTGNRREGVDGGPATSAILGMPGSLSVDRSGNLYLGDLADRRFRKVDAASGRISTVFGVGGDGDWSPGRPGPETAVFRPLDVIVGPDDDLYALPDWDQVFRISSKTGLVSLYAGGGTASPGDGGPATAAQLSGVLGLGLDAQGSLLLGDGNRIRKVDATSQVISTIAGGGDDGQGENIPATSASFNVYGRIATDASGSVWFADRWARVVKVSGGLLATWAGSRQGFGFAGDGGPVASSRLYHPTGVVPDGAGGLLVPDASNCRIRRIDLASGTIDTIAGNGTCSGAGDLRPAREASLALPVAAAVGPKGELYVAEPNLGRIRAVFPCTEPSRPQLVAPADGATVPFEGTELKWKATPGAFSYDVYLDTQMPPTRLVAANVPYSTTSPFHVPEGAFESTTVSNLLPGRVYYWQVVAKGDPNCLGLTPFPSAILSFLTTKPCTPPAPFVPLTPASGSTLAGTATTLTWSPSEGARFYDLYLGATSPPRLFAQSLTGTSASVSGLSPSTRYTWFLVAWASCDPTKATGSASATFLTPGPCESVGPFSLASPPNGAVEVPSRVALSWTAAEGAAGYDVYLGRATDPPLYHANVGPARLDVAGLSPGATYSWKVVARSPCDPAKDAASPVSRFTVSGTCPTPPSTSFTFAPPGKVAVGQSYVVAWAPVGLDPGGGYLVERSRDPAFATVLDTQVTPLTAASFVATQAGAYHHRVFAVAGCDPARRSPASPTAVVEAVDGKPVVLFTKPPQALVTPLGGSLDAALDAVDPEKRARSFTIQNLGTKAVTAIVALNALAPSPTFFRVDDPRGGSAASGIPLAPGETRTLLVAYSGISGAVPASYQGVVYVFSAGQEIVPYAFVNLKVGGRESATPQLLVNGKASEYAFFPGLDALADDGDRPPIRVDVKNGGATPMELAVDIGPEVWLEPAAGWNDTAIPPGGARTVELRTRRARALAGSALPRYTYLTFRTRDGATARLLVQDNDAPPRALDPRVPLAPDATSYVVPSVVNALSRLGNTFVSRLRLSNAGSEDVQADLVFTPREADGFDAAAVRRFKVTVPRNDVVTLTDPLVQLFGLAPPVSGQLEVRADASRIGLLTVTSAVDAAAQGGGTFGFQLPTFRSGEGATLGRPHVVPGVSVNAALRTNLILAETTGRDAVEVRVAFRDRGGALLGETRLSVPRYGQRQIALADLAPAGVAVSGGLVELSVGSGGGAVAGVVTVVDNRDDDASALVSRAADAAAAPSLSALAGRRPSWAGSAGAAKVRSGIPSVVNGFRTFPGTSLPYTFRTLMGFTSAASTSATFRLVYTDLSQSGRQVERTVTVAGRTSVEYANVLEELFGIPSGQASQGPVLVESDPHGLLYCRVYSVLPNGTLGDAFPVIPLPPEPQALVTGPGLAAPLAADGLEQSVDASRGTRTNLILNEWSGRPATVSVALYEAGNRTRPIAERAVPLGALGKVQLSTVFRELDLDTDERRKDRTNVLCVVRPLSGEGLVSAVVTTIDNRTGDTRNVPLLPAGGTTGPGVTIGF